MKESEKGKNGKNEGLARSTPAPHRQERATVGEVGEVGEVPALLRVWALGQEHQNTDTEPGLE